jgi:hypothetical protein
MDKVSMAKDMERQDQKHAVEMAGKILEHKTAMDIKRETAKHNIKMKEKTMSQPKTKSVKKGEK